jgi:hypothetical protein
MGIQGEIDVDRRGFEFAPFTVVRVCWLLLLPIQWKGPDWLFARRGVYPPQAILTMVHDISSDCASRLRASNSIQTPLI